MTTLTKDEAAVYDRQIRVWGVDTQQRLSSTKWLLIGSGGIIAEVAKNLVLAGAGLVSLLDDTVATEMSAPTFLAGPWGQVKSVAAVSAAALQEMNPLVKVQAVQGSPANACREVESGQYDVVLLANQPFEQMLEMDEACSKVGCAFFAARCLGTSAFFFANLHRHTCDSTEKQEGSLKGSRTVDFCSLTDALAASLPPPHPKRPLVTVYALYALAAWERKHHRRPAGIEDLAALVTEADAIVGATSADDTAAVALELAGAGSGDMAALNAIVGGVLANELLKAVSRKGEPVNNVFMYDTGSGIGRVHRIGS